jgi:predicted CXXCH cytochrome family protein
MSSSLPRKFLLLIPALAWITLTEGIAGAGIMFPPNNHLATEAEILFRAHVGEKAPKTLSVSTTTGGKKNYELKPGFAIVPVKLLPGTNLFSWGEETRTVFLSGGEEAPPEGFVAHRLHEAVEDCANCHGDQGPSSFVKEIPDLCYECHDHLSEGKKSVHPPVADGECLSCHRQHYSTLPKLLGSSAPGLCLDCHDDPAKDKEGKEHAVPHDPVASGDCHACHAVHSSAVKPLLKDEEAKLCVECHDDPTGGEQKKASVHDPVGSGECTSCHTLHGAARKSLLTAGVPKLCQECHDSIGLGESGEEYQAPHDPVSSGECLSCHDAHASDTKPLLTKGEPALCFECHEDPRKAGKGVDFPYLHDALDDGCLPCHRAHGSETKAMLVSPGADLCQECHDDVSRDAGGFPFASLHPPVEEGACVSCHRPHAGKFRKLLNESGNQFCLNCHTEAHANHRSTQPSQVIQTVIPETFPVDKRRNELACQGCHLPHGSHNEYLFNQVKDVLCALCHAF